MFTEDYIPCRPHEANAHPDVTSPATPDHIARDDCRSLIRLCADLHNVARMATVCTSILNASLAHAGPDVDIRSIHDFLPAIPKLKERKISDAAI